MTDDPKGLSAIFRIGSHFTLDVLFFKALRDGHSASATYDPVLLDPLSLVPGVSNQNTSPSAIVDERIRP